MARSWLGRWSVAVIAGASVLTGCQSLHHFDTANACKPRDGMATRAPGADQAKDGRPHKILALDRTGVKRVQSRLAGLGYAPGPADGVMGPRTRKAIARFQAANCLPPTGVISSRFLEYLGAAAARPAARERTSERAAGHARVATRGAGDKPPPPGPAKDAQTSATLDAGDSPAYEPGTTFVYSNGYVDRVAGVKGGSVKWVRSDGTAYTADRNFLLPWRYWSSDDERGSAKVSGPASRLWPIRKGAEVAFSADVTVQRKDDSNSTEHRVDHWRCRNEGQRRITVPAGEFETFAFVCKGGAKPGSAQIVRMWYYATEVRHFVRYIEVDPEEDGTRSYDLVAVRPGVGGWPPVVRAALSRAIVQALESPEKRARKQWRSSGVNSRVTIEAKSRLNGDGGRPCRRFVQIWSDNGRNRAYPALACKSASGTWRIPGVEDAAGSRLVSSGQALLR